MSWTPCIYPVLYIGTDGYAHASFVAGISSAVPGRWQIITSPMKVNDNTWHHLAFVISMYYDTLYVDGVVAGTAYTLQNFNTICPPQGGVYTPLGVGYVGIMLPTPGQGARGLAGSSITGCSMMRASIIPRCPRKKWRRWPRARRRRR